MLKFFKIRNGLIQEVSKEDEVVELKPQDIVVSSYLSEKLLQTANFVDFLLSENNQVTLEDKSGLPSIFSKDIIENYNSKPIRLDTGLLVFLDNLKRKQFLSEWNSAISQ